RVVDRGQTVTVSRSLLLVGNAGVTGQIVTSALDSLSGAPIRQVSEPVTLTTGGAATGAVSLDTAGLAARPYIATVELISASGERLFRGVAGFEVEGPPVGDTTPPAITISGISDGQCGAQASVTPQITVTDESAFSVDITLDGHAFASATPVTAEGT